MAPGLLPTRMQGLGSALSMKLATRRTAFLRLSFPSVDLAIHSSMRQDLLRRSKCSVSTRRKMSNGMQDALMSILPLQLKGLARPHPARLAGCQQRPINPHSYPTPVGPMHNCGNPYPAPAAGHSHPLPVGPTRNLSSPHLAQAAGQMTSKLVPRRSMQKSTDRLGA